MKTTLKIIGVAVFAVAIGVGIGMWGARDTSKPVKVPAPVFVAVKPATPAVKPAPAVQQGTVLHAQVTAQFDNSK